MNKYTIKHALKLTGNQKKSLKNTKCIHTQKIGQKNKQNRFQNQTTNFETGLKFY